MPKLRKVGDVWYAEYYDSQKGYTVRRSTGTDDRREALRTLGELIAKGSTPTTVARLKASALSDILAAYYAENTELPSRYSIKAALSYVVEEIPTKSVEWFTEENQKWFIQKLRAKKRAEGTIQRTMGIIGRALRLAYRKANSTETPYVVTVKSNARRTRILSDDEARALINACESENERRLVLLLLTTGSRPQALMDLSTSQLDREHRLIFLNPEGRGQNEKKHRPTIPMTEALYSACESWENGPVFRTDHGTQGEIKRIGNVKYIWNRLRIRAELPSDVTSYTCRHTVATELRRQAVPEWDISGYLGHKAPGSSTTAIYAHWRPDYMIEAANAMDRYWRRLTHADRSAALLPGKHQT